MANSRTVTAEVLRRWAALGRSVLLAAALAIGPPPGLPRSVTPAAITLDGQRDASYVLLAVDPTADLDSDFSGTAGYAWADLTALYAVTDTANLYIYVDLPAYSNDLSTGQYALAIDATGDTQNSGGTSDPRGHLVTFAYTATQVNSGTVPVASTNIVLPDFVIRGNVPGPASADNGYAELRTWNGATWTGMGTNWGGIWGTALVSERIAYANGNGLEFSIPYADLGLSPTVRLNLQFISLLHYVNDMYNTGAIDTVPTDDQAVGWGDDTTQRSLASQLPPPICASAAPGDSAVAAAGLAHDNSLPAFHQPPGPLAAGASAAFTLRACADDLQGVQLLVWQTANPLGAAPVLTLTLTSTVQSGYALWTGTASAPLSGANQWYQFRLVDGGSAGYFRPVTGGSGPGLWAAMLGAPAWSWPTVPGVALYLPLAVKP
ncbi:MAG: hypothetical protein IT317_06595 [Anaerolineales bacterium]|nr:hypothetical protein [Anaerolineales bacterium]